MPATTIKVSSELRDKLNAEARHSGRTVAEVIGQLIDERDRAERFRRIREARARTSSEQLAEAATESTVFETAALDDLESYDD